MVSSSMIVLLFFINLYTFIRGDGLDLPSYIPKCALSDPKFNECFKENANKVIPIIAKGDEALGFPSVTPLLLPEAPIVGTDVNYIVYDFYTDNIKDIRISKASFDLKAGKMILNATLEQLHITGKNYTILSGKIAGVGARGHGACSTTNDGVKFDYIADLRIVKKNKEDYLELVNPDFDFVSDRLHCHFENLQGSDGGDVGELVQKDWEKLYKQLQPAYKTYLTTIVHYPLAGAFSKIPLNKWFLP